MRLVIHAFLLATALGSANVATACPIDLAPCEESIRPGDLLIDQEIGSIVLSSPALGADTSSSDALLGEADAPQDIVLLNHEDEDLIPSDYQVTADVTAHEDPTPDQFEPLPAYTTLVDSAAVPTRRFLIDDEDIIDAEHTASVETVSTALDVGGWAQDGHEDR